MTRSTRYQTRLQEFATAPPEIPNIPAYGDSIPYEVEETHIRFAFQNIHGMSKSRGLESASEIHTMSEWNIDVMGMSETNRPWTASQKSEYDFMMASHFYSSRTLYTAAPSLAHDQTYQPGGNLLTINGRTTGRIYDSGTDSMGRFCWYALRGKRDEGVLIITAYRVCHKTGDDPGPFTAYQQQHTMMRAAGVANPNPRKQILKDIATLIQVKREEGLRPIVMMDANGDYINGTDNELRDFIHTTGMCDPFYDKFNISPPTYIYGTKRLDYILMDPTLTGAITRIGYLGTHDGVLSDHTMAVMDMCEHTLFAGILNRPPTRHSREILIAQADKVQAFLQTLHPLLKEHEVERRTYELATAFVQEGATDDLIHKYHVLYKQFLELTNGASKQAGRKKYGYKRSSALVHASRMRCAYKKILDCKRRHTEASDALRRYCDSLALDPDIILATHTLHDLRKLVRKLGQEQWEIQKTGETHRVEWLRTRAQDVCRVTGDPNWEGKMNAMIRTTEENAVNRKLSAITKGRRGVLERIQVPSHTWFYSPAKHELYHYDVGVFEAYPIHEDGTFYRHHTLKVPATDVILVMVGVDPDTSRWIITETLPTPQTMWVDITSQSEIEAALLARNKRHLQQTAREQGISTRPPLTTLRVNHGFNDMATAVLDGAPFTDYPLTREMEQLFLAMKRTPTDRALPPIFGEFTSDDIKAMFKAAKEKTSSDPRTLNYTLWKCLATDDKIAGILSILFSLPFTYGFVNDHWTAMTDFMIEKKAGVRQIHTLRIIGKVAAEFNTCLKYLIGKRARDNFEATDTCDEQHGFRPSRSSIDAAMLKLLTFESARMQKCTLASVQHDMTAHFDRMYPETTAMLGTKYGVDKSILLCINKTIALLRRNVETALGTSEASYHQTVDEPHMGGMVQGKADVPQWSTQQSDAMLKAHKVLTEGVHIHSPNMQRDIRHSSIAFADDTDGQETTPTDEPTAIHTVVRKLEHSAQTWSNIVQICGGLIALHKCNWQLIAWELQAGHLKLVQATDERVVLDDGNGSFAVIDFLPPHQPNVGLGYRICPDGSQKHHFDATLDAVAQLCRSTKGAYLTEAEARQLLHQRLLPKITYALHATSFSEAECNKINSEIRSTFLPLTRLNRHFPSAVLYGPSKFGGLDFPEINDIQDRTQLDYLIKQLRWDKTVANTFLVTLDNVQLCSGFTTPLLEHTHTPISYLDKSYIIDLRRRLGSLDATIWIEKAWTSSLQRVGDMALMERFTSIPRVTRAQLRQANAVRLYMRVITIADLCDTTGRFVPNGMLNGDFQAGSDLMWPYQPRPPKSFFSTFRKLLRQSFCTHVPLHHCHKDSMDLDQPLGRWLPVPRNTWSPAYRTVNEIYWRPQDDWDMHVLRRSPVSGFFHFSHTTRTLPLDSHPIQYRQIGESIWTQKPYRMQTLEEGITLPPGHVVENTLSDPHTETLTIGSDGSVYLKDEVAACAWMIAETEESKATACFLLGNISSLSSYRSELEGIFRSLKHVQYLGLQPGEIQHWCDNESAVNDCNKSLRTPSAMIKPDADILLAIHHLREVMSDDSTIICKHIYGHQDSKPRDTPHVFRDSVDIEQDAGDKSDDNELPCDIFAPDAEDDEPSRRPAHPRRRPLPVTANIEADRLASETATLAREEALCDPLPQAQMPPYEGSRALLKIGDTWITTPIAAHIRGARWTHQLREYCLQKYNWTAEIFDSIDWKLVMTARKKCSKTQMMQTSKIMHDWLPVMHMLGHITGLKQCPACAHQDETLAHMFHCPHPALVRKRMDTLTLARKKGHKLGLPSLAVTSICGLLNECFTGQEYVPIARNQHMDTAILAQRQIGLNFLPRGFLAVHWQQAIETLRCENGDRKLAHFLFFLWTEVTLKIWDARNDIVHHGNNLTRQADESRVDRTLRWYKFNHQDVLARTDFRLTNYNPDELHIMTLATKKERVRQLEIAKTAHTLECRARAKGLHTITRFLIRKPEVQQGDDVE